MKKSVLALALLLNALVFNPLAAQSTAKHVAGDLLVSLEPGTTAERVARLLNEKWAGLAPNFSVVKKVADPMNIWLLHSELTDEKAELNLLAEARRTPGVAVAQFNHITVERGRFDPAEFGREMESLKTGLSSQRKMERLCSTTPNDPQFAQQWQYINNGASGGTVDADIDADLAWDVTTGGLTPDGDTIVVCVVDGGVNTAHPDFGDNIWKNNAEIPGNGIDDDANGYIDDYRGWSTYTSTDVITTNAGHGTCVAGIIGAQGNNGVGVAGVNWDVKIMVVAGGSGTEANAIAGYAYPYSFRKLYNETGGKKGAFVVATNSSWGVDLGQPADAPLWCAFYDTLGKVGILSCGATANANYNIDTQGDLPTACPSDYLIAVTNCGRNGKKVTSAGYGLTTIDLGSFGENTWTLSQTGYAAFGGTSGATPHVTGTIALMYSAPCGAFIALAKSDPAQAALNLKKYIMDGVKPEATLVGKCITGGRLNTNQAIQNLLTDCSACPKPYSVAATEITQVSAKISFSKLDATAAVNLRWHPAGAANWTVVSGVSSPYALVSLDPCTGYEVELEMVCADSTSGWSPAKTFKTDGCCDPVANLNVSSLTANSATISWSPVTAAIGYKVDIAAGGPPTTISLDPTQTSYKPSNLPSCTAFQVIVHTLCAGGLDVPTAPVSFKTKGCGACTDSPYCASAGGDATSEWIEKVAFSSLLHQNTAGSAGYGDQTAESATVQQYHVYPLTMTPGFSGNTYNEWFRAWIDLNEDGTFTDPGERVFDGQAAAGAAVTGSVSIGNLAIGTARMRVSMKYITGGGTKPQPCDAFNYGQVKDFCVDIQAGAPDCAPPPAVNLSAKTDTTASLTWAATPFADQYFVRINIKGQTATQDFTATTNQIVLKGLAPCTEYEAYVWPKCGSIESLSKTYFLFKTNCGGLAANDPAELDGVFVAPNPFAERLTVSLFAEKSGEAGLELFSASGQLVDNQRVAFASGENRTTLDTERLSAGVYFLKVKTTGGVAVRRVVKN